MIFCAIAQSDIMPYGIVIFLPLAKVILYSPPKLAKRISLGRSPNITAKQYHSPKANITKKLLEKSQGVFCAYNLFLSKIEDAKRIGI